MKEISHQLIAWYHQNKRDLPWRNTQDPYKIWLSEIILQQTRVEQGTPYYLHFIETYPTVFDLANAPEAQVLRSWQGLGYYSRARNLHFAAKEVLAKHKGQFPNNYETLIQLKGVGEYTAAAIASFAFGEAKAVVDGNVFRVLARLFNIATPINTGAGKKEFTVLANQLIDPKNPALFNQAIMEFGAMQCKPKPICETCPFQQMCSAYEKQNIDQLPVKNNKLKIRARYFHYLHIEHEGGLYINRRIGKDIWQHLYEMPLIETVSELPENEMMQNAEWQNIFADATITIQHISTKFKHVLTHQHIYAKFWKINVSPEWHKNQAFYQYIKDDELKIYPIPRLIEQYFQKNT
jgi:A/G-specific adenine glycosylase